MWIMRVVLAPCAVRGHVAGVLLRIMPVLPPLQSLLPLQVTGIMVTMGIMGNG